MQYYSSIAKGSCPITGFCIALMQNPCRLSNLGCVLEPEVVKGVFQNRESGHFSY